MVRNAQKAFINVVKGYFLTPAVETVKNAMQKNANKCNPTNNVDMERHRKILFTTNDAEGPSCRIEPALNISIKHEHICCAPSCIGQPMAVFCIMLPTELKLRSTPANHPFWQLGPQRLVRMGVLGCYTGFGLLHLFHGFLLLLVTRSGEMKVSSTFPFCDRLASDMHNTTCSHLKLRRYQKDTAVPSMRVWFWRHNSVSPFCSSVLPNRFTFPPTISQLRGTHLSMVCQKTRKLKARQMQRNAKRKRKKDRILEMQKKCKKKYAFASPLPPDCGHLDRWGKLVQNSLLVAQCAQGKVHPLSKDSTTPHATNLIALSMSTILVLLHFFYAD